MGILAYQECYVYGYRMMVKGVSCCCVHGSRLLSSLVTYSFVLVNLIQLQHYQDLCCHYFTQCPCVHVCMCLYRVLLWSIGHSLYLQVLCVVCVCVCVCMCVIVEALPHTSAIQHEAYR